MREAMELAEATSDYYAQPLNDNLYEWHFTVRGSSDSDFSGGVYHGKILLPTEYPMKPPNIIFLTPNGRFETGTKICLTISEHHPSLWRPSWSIRTALLAIIGFMPTPAMNDQGSLDLPPAQRKLLAKNSVSFVCPECCPDGQTILDLLKSPEEEARSLVSRAGNETSNLGDQGSSSLPKSFASRAEEAKELSKHFTLAKAEDEQVKGPQMAQESSAGDHQEMTPERRRIKEASKRMQDRFRAKLLARTENIARSLTRNSGLGEALQADQATLVSSNSHTERVPSDSSRIQGSSSQAGTFNRRPDDQNEGNSRLLDQDEAAQFEGSREVRTRRGCLDSVVMILVSIIAAILIRRLLLYIM